MVCSIFYNIFCFYLSPPLCPRFTLPYFRAISPQNTDPFPRISSQLFFLSLKNGDGKQKEYGVNKVRVRAGTKKAVN